jgi:hypothetical protein
VQQSVGVPMQALRARQSFMRASVARVKEKLKNDGALPGDGNKGLGLT